MKKILLPTDFSKNSWNAIKYALQLFKDEECMFTLLNIYTPVIYQVEHLQASEPQLRVLEVAKEMSKKKLNEIYKQIKVEFHNSKHTYSQISAFNIVTVEIDQLFEANVMDLIIMGTKGASGLKEILFGSNTVHVLKNAKCPVIAVPDVFEFEPPHEILFPSDYEVNFEKRHVQPIIDIANLYNLRINVLHVCNDKNLSALQESNKRKLDIFFGSIAHLFHLVKHKNVTDAILDFQLKSRINLLVMINNKHSFFENLFFKSTIKHIGFHLHVPFLVIPCFQKT